MRRLMVAGLMVLVCAVLVVMQPAAARDGWLDVPGGRSHYTDDGHGPPIILIHGYTASADKNWRAHGIIASLAAKYRVIAIDVRGHGQSDKTSVYGIEMVHDIVRLQDHLGIARCPVIGYSMGGMITMKLAATHPDRVTAAAVCGMGWMQPAVARMARRGGEPIRASWVELALSRDEMLAIRVPLHLVVGENDRIVRQLYLDPLMKLRPDIPVTLISGAGHITCVVQPDFRASLELFLSNAR